MAGPIVVAIDGDNRGLSTSIGQSESKIKRFAGVAGKVGRVAAAGLLVAGAAVTGVAVSSVKAASTAEQSLGATQTVFGKYADSVVKQSNRADKQFGLSANSYRENANLIGSLFRNQGVEADKLAGKTRGMISTAADLAATFGGPTSEAVAALGSAFKGEFDPLERYGISIKQSAINAELAARGQDKLTGAALKAAQQQATTRLIMEQSARSVGAFGRESNTLANRQQVLGAQLENVKVKIGNALTPSLTRLATVVSNKVMPPLADLADRYAPKVAGAIDKLAGSLPGVISGFGKGGPSAGQYGKQLSGIAGDLRKLGPAIADAAGELPSLTDVLSVGSTVIGFAADHVDTLAKALPYLAIGYVAVKAGQLASNVAALAGVPIKIAEIAVNRQLVASNKLLIASRAGDTIATTANTTAQNVGVVARARSVVGMAAHRVAMVASAAATRGMAVAQRVLNVALISNPIGAVIAGLVLLGVAVTVAWRKSETFRKIVTGAWNGIKAATSAVFGVVRTVITATWRVVSSVVSSTVSRVRGFVTGAWNVIRSATSSAWNTVRGAVSGAIRAVQSAVSSGVARARSAVSGAWGAVRSATSDAWGAVTGAVRTAVGNVISAVREIPGKITSALSGAGTMLLDVGRDIIGGLISGIRGAAGSLVSTIQSYVIDKIPGPVRKALGISSPSRVMRKIGRQTVDGLTEGIKDRIAKLDKQRDELVKKVKATASEARQAALQYAGILQAGGDVPTADSITQGMLERLEAVRAFRQQIKQLEKAGLNDSVLKQLIAGGVEGSGATAAALVAGGSDAIKQVNQLQNQINQAAGQLGATATAAVNERARKQITQLERRIARLRGSNARREQLNEHGRQRARDGHRRLTATVKLTGEQQSQLARGKQIRLDLDAYESDGGKKGANK